MRQSSHNPVISFLLREWLPGVAAAGLLLTSLYIGSFPDYSMAEIEVLALLFALFVVVRGLEKTRLILWVTRRMEQTDRPALQLVLATFFLSMLITNDAALVLLVPLGLALPVKNKGLLVILLALAANAGSALTPLGNPQNLFIYWYYHLSPLTFVRAIAPFSLPYLALLALLTIAFCHCDAAVRSEPVRIHPMAWLHGLFFLLLILTILHILPAFALLIPLAFSLFFDRQTLRIDYGLLLSFFFFFGLAENLKLLLAAEVRHADHIFIFSALASQLISNVPAALLFAKFTNQWQALLWGTNVGGFGSLVGSLANLIAYRIYVSSEDNRRQAGRFTLLFVAMGYVCFFLGVALYKLSQHG
jgi:Na+/H+ antiporter NhaD/arsenite permease-like protein